MPNSGLPPSLPLAATIDLQYRLPPPQQLIYTPTILISAILLFIALVAVIYMSRRTAKRAKEEARLNALRMAEKILLKRGGTHDDVDRVMFIFKSQPKLDVASLVMIKTRFHEELYPLLEVSFDKEFAEKMEKIYFPPPKDTRRALAAQSANIKEVVEEQKAAAVSQTQAAIIDLMDATLKPGVIVRLTFENIEGGYECMVMGHDSHTINITLPANNDRLVASLKQGMRVDGTLESGPSLLAFQGNVIQAIAGSMPYCRITPWKTAWEIRKRDSMRLPVSVDIDFQHISTASTGSIRMSSLEKEIGTIKPGKLVDISLGGCGIETPSTGTFHIGDMLRFSKALIPDSPPATLLGALVKIDSLNPAQNDGSAQRLHVQFLIVDDVSQRILVRTVRQLQDAADREEWMQAQLLMQRMRRNKIENIGSPAATAVPKRNSTTSPKASKGTDSGPAARKSTRTIHKVKPPSTRSVPKTTLRPSSRSFPAPPPGSPPPPRPSTRNNPPR